MSKVRPIIIFLSIICTTVVSVSCNLPLNPQKITNFLPISTATPSPLPTLAATPTPSPSPTPIPQLRVESGEAALANGDWFTAEEEFSAVLLDNPQEIIQFEALLGQIRTSVFQGDSQSVIKLAEPLLQQSASQNEFEEIKDIVAQTYFFLGQAYMVEENFNEAASAFEGYLDLRPGLIDAYVQDLRGDALFAAGDYLNAALSFNAAIQSPSTLDQTFLEMKLARSYALAGDTNQALTIYDDLKSRIDNINTLALINLRKGQIFTDLGDTEKANEVFLDAVINYPSAYEAYSALLVLVDAGIAVDELNRGLVDFYAGEYGAALAAFDRYLLSEPSDPGTAYYFTGMAHNAGGRYEQAIQFWDKLINQFPEHPYWDDAWEQKGFTQWFYLDDYPSAIETLSSFAKNNPTHSRAAEFLFDAARVAERSDDLSKSAELWRSVTLQYPNDERAKDGLFLSGISLYRQENYTEALQTFKGCLGVSQAPFDRSRAYFWIGKTYQKLGDEENGAKSFLDASIVDPTGYYSERARDVFSGKPPFDPPGMFDLAYDPNLEQQQAEAWLRNNFVLTEGTDLSGLGELIHEPALVRGAELWKLGLQYDARVEFEALRQSFASDPVLSYRLVNYFSRIGLHRSATFASRNVLNLAGLDDSSSLLAPMLFNRNRFPTHFSDLVIPAAEEEGLHPFLLFSVIRQESLFESFVQSSAAAQGLMQIIPSTGEEIAKDLNWPENYTEKDLYRPIVNIRFGASYLAKQLDFFDGDLFAALAAYNGGPGNAAHWKELSKGDQDLFVEIIRFAETKDYIRSIYEIFSIYRRLYDRTP